MSEKGFYGRRMVPEPLLKLLKKLGDAGVTDEDIATLAGLAEELAGKANLEGGNEFTGEQDVTDGVKFNAVTAIESISNESFADLMLGKASKTNIPFENIKDSDEHNRFIEGNLNVDNILASADIKYNKWNLSGCHLMLVLAFNNNSGSDITLNAFQSIASVQLPEWIHNKIYTIDENLDPVSFSGLNEADLSIPSISKIKDLYIAKHTSYISIVTPTQTTIKDGCCYRIQFDLIIDND